MRRLYLTVQTSDSIVTYEPNVIHMNSRIRDWRPGRVLVVGDVMLDRYWSGPAARISPEAPVPVVHVSEEFERVGGAANVAANIVALGMDADLIGGAGNDPASARLQELCDACGIAAEFVCGPKCETTVKLRVMSQHQQLLRLDFEAYVPIYDVEHLHQVFAKKLNEADIVVLSDYGKGFVADSRTLIAAAQVADKRVIVDPKSTDFSRYSGAYLITPNFAEFEATVGKCDNEAEIEERGANLCRNHNFEAVLVTRGEHGMTLVSPNFAAITLNAQARDVFDVTGAGDTVCAVVSAALAAGVELADAVVYANSAAGVAVGKMGTAIVTTEELENALQASAEPQTNGVVDIQELLPQISAAKRRGERIVMTNGCFDILHAGHVAYLKLAKALGSRLVVALNSDKSVARLKGAGRPIHQLTDRMAIVSALACVDWVISFDEDDPGALVEAINPDVLAKGGDYNIEDIVGGDHVLANGGEVRTLPYVDGLSSSAIIEKLVAQGTVKAGKR